MSEMQPGAAELAARQVEQIVAAAQEAAEQLRLEGRQQAEAILAEAREAGEQELGQARRRAVDLERDAREEARRRLEEAQHEAAQLREQTKRAVEGRVAAAEKAAAEVLEEARALSSGLRQLGESLGAQGERILRDVQAAHRRMQSELRVAPAPAATPRRADPRTEELAATVREAESRRSGSPARSSPSERPADRPRRANPLEDLEVPSWVGRRS